MIEKNWEMKLKKAVRYLVLLGVLFLAGLQRYSAENVQASEIREIRVLDGKISKQELFGQFGNEENKDYRYTLADQIAWKRVNYGDKDSNTPAENVQDGETYRLQKSKTGKDKWEEADGFQFRFYHKIVVTADAENFPEGGSVTVKDREEKDGCYEVYKGETLELEIGPVDGYEAQVKINEEAWQTCQSTYSFVSDRSAALQVRYVEQDPSKYSVTVSVTGAALGEYSGLTEAKMAAGESFILVVTPYNESSAKGDDLDAYVKSVKINGTEIDGNYEKTIFTAQEYIVTGDTSIEIEFAKRLVLKEKTVKDITKYEGDTPIDMYLVKYNTSKDVSDQVTEIEDYILASAIDAEHTAGYEKTTAVVKLKVYIDNNKYGGDYYGKLDDTVDEVVGESIPVVEKIWGNRSFGNDEEEWEEIQITLPATERYPEVITEDLNFYLEDIRPKLKIEGKTDPVSVDSEANIKGAIEAAVLEKIIKDHETDGVTEEKIKTDTIKYTYTAPKYDALKTTQTTEISVKVVVGHQKTFLWSVTDDNGKNTYYLTSTGTITVPVKKSDVPASLSLTYDEHGTATYTTDTDKAQYQITMTPEENYYVNTLTVVTTQEEQNESDTQILSVGNEEMKSSDKDSGYSYSYTLNAVNNHTYALEASFVCYSMDLEGSSDKFEYYDGLYEKEVLLEKLGKYVTVTKKIDGKEAEETQNFPEGTMTLEYLAGSTGSEEQWIPVGEEPVTVLDASTTEESFHRFGTQERETIRCQYVFAEDGFTITSNLVTVNVEDNRTKTELRWNDPPEPEKPTETAQWEISYESYSKAADKETFITEFVKENILDGVYAGDQKLENAEVSFTFTPALNDLQAGEDLKITAAYAGDTTYKNASSSVKIFMKPKDFKLQTSIMNSGVVPYGTEYTITTTATSEGNAVNVDLIEMSMGVDLSNVSLEELLKLLQDMIDPEMENDDPTEEDAANYCGITLNLSLYGKSKQSRALYQYLNGKSWRNDSGMDQNTELTLEEVFEGLTALSEEKLQEMGIPEKSLTNLMMPASYFYAFGDMPVKISDQQPENVGFYITTTTGTDLLYESTFNISCLLITPKFSRMDLEWKNSLTDSAVTTEQLNQKGFLDAAVKTPQTEKAGIFNMNLYIGVDPDGKSKVVTDQSKLTKGAYTQIAVAIDWKNECSASAPIFREFTVEGSHAEVTFVDEEGTPVLTRFFHTGASDIGMKVLVNGEELEEAEKENLKVTYRALGGLIFTTDDPEKDPAQVPTEPGIYLVNAVYRTSGATLTMGKATAVMIITDQTSGFSTDDLTTTYDGQEKFLTINDENEAKLPYFAVITNSEKKTINICFPEKYGSFSDLLSALGQEETLESLEEILPADMLNGFVKALISQVTKDTSAVTDWEISIDGDKPVSPGSYDVYLTAIAVTESEKEMAAGKYRLLIQKADAKAEPAKDTTEEITFGNTARLSVKLSGVPKGAVPTGTVDLELYRGEQKLKTKTVTLEDGKASWEIDDLETGAYTWKFSYSGDDHYKTADGEEQQLTVKAVEPSDQDPKEDPKEELKEEPKEEPKENPKEDSKEELEGIYYVENPKEPTVTENVNSGDRTRTGYFIIMSAAFAATVMLRKLRNKE